MRFWINSALFSLALVVFPQILFGIAASSDIEAQLDVEIVSKKAPKAYQLWGRGELRHYNPFVINNDGDVVQKPYVEARIKAGSWLYNGSINVFETSGLVKKPKTQQVTERRTEVELDYYPWYGKYGQIIVYLQNKLPWTDPEDLKALYDTTYTIGFSPLLVWPTSLGRSRLKLFVGTDIWAESYSSRQYIDPTDLTRDSREKLLALGRDVNDQEDYAARVYSVSMLGIGIKPRSGRGMLFELKGWYGFDNIPIYNVVDGNLSPSYKPVKKSWLRLRSEYKLSKRLKIRQDLYGYYRGFFRDRNVEVDDRQLSTTVTLLCNF